MHRQHGLTLIELMVSMVVGLVLMGGVVQVFKTNKGSNLFSQGLAEMQDNGSYALEFVSNQIGQIGYVPAWNNLGQVSDLNSDGIKNRLDMEMWAYGATAPIVGSEGSGTASDAITTNIYIDPQNPAPKNCVGAAVSTPGNFTGPPGWGVTNAIAVNSVNSTLTCNGVAVAEGVENMQILYGVDTSVPSDGNVDRYMRWSQVFAPPVDWRARIIAVRVALLVASHDPVTPVANSNTKNLLGTVVGPWTDRRLRTVYTATIRLHNRCAQYTQGSPCV